MANNIYGICAVQLVGYMESRVGSGCYQSKDLIVQFFNQSCVLLRLAGSSVGLFAGCWLLAVGVYGAVGGGIKYLTLG